MTRALQIEDLSRIALPQEPAMAPDGSRVVYVLRTVDLKHDRYCFELWTVDLGSGAVRRLTGGPADTSPAFSPDGRSIAFLRAGDDGPAQVHLLPTAGGEPERLTDLPCGAGRPVWSPDGTRIAFTAPVDPHPSTVQAPPLVADRLDYQADGRGLVGSVRNQIHVLYVDGSECVSLTAGFRSCSEPAWSPDGTRLAFCGPVTEDVDLDFTSAVFLIGADDPEGAGTQVGSGRGTVSTVTFAPDGSALLVTGTVEPGPGNASLRRIALRDGPDGATIAGDDIDLTAPLDRNVMPGAPAYPGGRPQLSSDGSRVLVCIRDDGFTHLYGVRADGSGPPRPVLAEPGLSVAGLSVAAGPGRSVAAVVVVTPDSFGEIAIVDLAADAPPRILTEHGGTLAAEVALIAPMPRAFTSPDGSTVHGWTIRSNRSVGATPLLLDIHGGPHNAWTGGADPVHLYHQVLAAAGWTILLVNPRGSDGYGDAFYRGVVGGWGLSDSGDLVSAVDQLVRDGIADPNRLAVTGYSYGGFMTCYLTAHDDRFFAAAAGGVISDLTSAAGTSDLGHQMAVLEQHLGQHADGQGAREQSPLTYASNVRTPTLILHGGDDRRCPVGQAQQWFSALRRRRVPTRLVIYPGASHLFLLAGRPSHLIDYNTRVAAWLEDHLPTGSPGPRSPEPASPVPHPTPRPGRRGTVTDG